MSPLEVPPLAPWQTAWPAGVALVVLLVAAWSARRLLGPARRDLPGIGLFVLVAAGVRLWAVPALARHVYDGHEAEYWDLFTGARAPNRGGTVLYPAMQWLWWSLGRLLPHESAVPVVTMVLVGVAGAGILALAVGRLGGRRAGWAAAAVLAVHPAQAAWSSSAYNVVVPFAFGALTLWCAASLASARRPSPSLAWLGAASFALAVATRLESALFALPAGLLLVAVRPEGQRLTLALRERAVLLPPAVVGLALAGLAAWPLVYPGEVPGAGERALAFAINVGIFDWYGPLATLPGLAALVLLALLAARRWPLHAAVLVGAAVVQHLVLSSFDDLGDRHTLVVLPGLVWTAGAGAAAGGRLRAVGLAALVVLLGVELVGLADLRERFYGSEEAFAARLSEAPWGGLPRVGLNPARDGCGWVNEDPRAAAEPVASHFNLLKPEEAHALRGDDGCLRWCLDVQDWRWSSRGVRDRALRLSHLYDLRVLSVVEEPTSGYSCLVYEVGPRIGPTGVDGPAARPTPRLP